MRNRMSNTVIIDSIIMHHIDMPGMQVQLSDATVNLETATDYYDKKIEKCLANTNIKEVVVGKEHHILNLARNMLPDDYCFAAASSDMAEEMFDIIRYITEMPSSDLVFVKCKVDGKRHIIVMKLNYKPIPVRISQKDENGNTVMQIAMQESLPSGGSAVDEAIIINVDDEKIFLIEKRFQIDGKPSYYLNEQYVKGEPKLSDKQKLNLLSKVVKKVDSEFSVLDANPVAVVKKAISDRYVENVPLKPVEIIRDILADDAEASEEAELIMQDLGLMEDDTITNVPASWADKLSRCKIVLDNDRVIEMNVEDYLKSINMEKSEDDGGMTKITLNNISDISVK